MAIIANDTNRFSAVVAREYDPASSFCRDEITYNGTGVQLVVGTVLGRYYTGLTGTATATAGNTGNGAMGTITMSSVVGLDIGTYTLRIVKTVTNAGDFVLLSPTGRVVGTGSVATAFNQAGFSFTLADGSTDFVAGDSFSIEVAGTAKYKIVEATATDGSQVATAVYVANTMGLSDPVTPTANTDTKLLALVRGPVILKKAGLVFGASVTTGALTNKAYAQLTAAGMIPETSV